MFGWLTEFWNAITDVVVGSTTYTIDFFKQIGSAVAGAIGNIFLLPLQIIVDFGLAIGWILAQILNILFDIIAPFRFVAIFLYTFITSLFSQPAQVNLFTQNQQSLSFLSSLPYWSVLSTIIIGLVVVTIIVATIKSINL